MKEKYYLTTPIYYPSDKLHIGHSYTTVVADTLARYKKLRGFDVRFLTGTDEHGQKIERIAKEKNVTPKAYVDEIVRGIKELWALLDIEYDDFIRTTEDRHIRAVQKIFKALYDKGDIYKSTYEGKYCTPCETFFTERQLADGKCPDCGRDVETVQEESYFFRLSKYQERLIRHMEENEDFVQPASRRNEMLNNFLKPGLEDLCVSRTSFTWGIPVTFDEGHVVYVWIDALSNYVTALGYLSGDDSLYRQYWPADVHIVGKEIVRFHTIIWPAMLMALEQPLPKRVFGHGWLVIDGGKMSKSKGNVVDPNVLIGRYGVDAVRYFLLREFAFGQDGNFSNELLVKRINADLANDLGNLLSRTVGMIDKYFGGALPVEQEKNGFDAEIIFLAGQTVLAVEELLDKMMFSDALASIWTFIRRCNKYVDETAPWVLAKDAGKKAELANVLYVLAESLRIVSILIAPFMPRTPGVIRAQLCMADEALFAWEALRGFGKLPRAIRIEKGAALFPRLDMEEELAALAKEMPVTAGADTNEAADASEAWIGMEEFGKVALQVGEVVACEKVKGSDRLLKSRIRIGERTRQIVSGIAAYYAPEEMVGRKVVVVTNLKPVKLRGELSEGMILAAEDEQGRLALVTVDKDLESGAVVC